jgi:predicted CopG family antitoxin
MNKVKINITIDEDLFNWLNEMRDMVPLSTFINYLLAERKEAEDLIKNYKKDTGSLKAFILKALARVKGGDKFLEILSNEYLTDS